MGTRSTCCWAVDAHRTLGIDTPERRKPGYKADRGQPAVGRRADRHPVKDKSDTDRYGRLLRYVYLGDGTMANAVSGWWARSRSTSPDTAYAADFRRATWTQLNRRGFWSGTSPYDGPCPTPTRRDVELRRSRRRPGRMGRFAARRSPCSGGCRRLGAGAYAAAAAGCCCRPRAERAGAGHSVSGTAQ